MFISKHQLSHVDCHTNIISERRKLRQAAVRSHLSFTTRLSSRASSKTIFFKHISPFTTLALHLGPLDIVYQRHRVTHSDSTPLAITFSGFYTQRLIRFYSSYCSSWLPLSEETSPTRCEKINYLLSTCTFLWNLLRSPLACPQHWIHIGGSVRVPNPIDTAQT